MRFKILSLLYSALPLSSYRPKSLKYRAICKKTEQYRIDLETNLNSDQQEMLAEYTTLIYQQAILEEQQAFYQGVRVGVEFVKEIHCLKKGDK